MKKTFSVLFCFMLLFCSASAHAGRTDAADGHWDRSSGTYHYHHGYPAHQHTNGICPYGYDDQTSVNSSSNTTYPSVQSSASTDTTETEMEDEINWKDPSWEWVPDEYAYMQDFSQEYPIGSHIIMRKYYYDDNGYMYTPYRNQLVPHGAVETDNSQYLDAGSFSSEDDKPRFDYFTLDEIVYQFGLQDQSLQFQEGAYFGLNEAYLLSQFYSQSANDVTDDTTLNEDIENDLSTYDSAANDSISSVDDNTSAQQPTNSFEFALGLMAALFSGFGVGYAYKHRNLEQKLNELQSSFSSYKTSQTIFRNQSFAERDELIKKNGDQAAQIRYLTFQLQATCSPSSDNDFGPWNPSALRCKQQFDRYQRSKSDPLSITNRHNDVYTIHGTSDTYETTLNSCNCPDFIINLHSKLPCKHIYFLARIKGIDVDAIFNDYMENCNDTPT